MKQTNINLKQLNSIISTIVEEKMDAKTELKNAYDQLKRAKDALRAKGKKHGELKELTKALRKASDEIMELDDAVTDEMRENEETEVMEKNEKSEGHGKYFGIDENKKTKVIKLKESDLRKVIKKVIQEQEDKIEGVDRGNIDDMVVKFVKEKRTVGPEFLLKRIARCPGPLFPLNTSFSAGGSGDSVFPGSKEGTLEIVYKGKTYKSDNICGGMDMLVKSFLDPNSRNRKTDFLKLINEFLENRTDGVMNMTKDQIDSDDGFNEKRFDKFRWKDTGDGKYALVKV